MFKQFFVDLVPQRQHGLPLHFSVRLGHARIFVDARDLHQHIHLGLANFRCANDRCGR